MAQKTTSQCSGRELKLTGLAPSKRGADEFEGKGTVVV
jgi:hypothetical protein